MTSKTRRDQVLQPTTCLVEVTADTQGHPVAGALGKSAPREDHP